jgi:hypothetical protein
MRIQPPIASPLDMSVSDIYFAIIVILSESESCVTFSNMLAPHVQPPKLEENPLSAAY